jgi:phenylacetate-CoA ligase
MIPNVLARPVYLLQTRIRGEHTDRHLEELLRTQWLSRDELAELQWKKVTRLLHHAYENSPYYRKRFQEHGVSPEQIQSPGDLSRVPLLTKEELRKNYSEMAVTESTYKYSAAKSSGSTGQSVKFWKDHRASGAGRAAMMRGHSWYGVNIGDREATLWGVPLSRSGRIRSRIRDFLLNRFREKNFQLSDEVLRSFYEKMKRVRPAYLMGYSSLVYEFAQFMQQQELDGAALELRMVKVTAESLFDYQRELIEQVFSTSVANEYGAAEVGIVAFECPERGLHITAEGVYVEELDTSVPDVGAELVITDLDNFYSPIIRYRVGDYGRCSDMVCRCERGLPLLRDVVGRTSDVVHGPDGTVFHSSIFSYILKEITGRDGGIAKYRVYQDQKGRLEFEIVRAPTFTDDTVSFLKALVADEFGSGMETVIRFVDVIEREPSGKLRYFISRVQ